MLSFNGRWEAGLAKIVAKAILTGLLPPGFREAVKKQVEYENVGADPEKVVITMDRLGEKWSQYEKIFGRERQERQPQAQQSGGHTLRGCDGTIHGPLSSRWV